MTNSLKRGIQKTGNHYHQVATTATHSSNLTFCSVRRRRAGLMTGLARSIWDWSEHDNSTGRGELYPTSQFNQEGARRARRTLGKPIRLGCSQSWGLCSGKDGNRARAKRVRAVSEELARSSTGNLECFSPQ